MQTKRVVASIGATAAVLGLLVTGSVSPASASTNSPQIGGEPTDGMTLTGTYETYAGCSARLWVFGLDPKRPYSAACEENSNGDWELWTMNQ